MALRLHCAGAVILLTLTSNVWSAQYGMPVKTLSARTDSYVNQQQASSYQATSQIQPQYPQVQSSYPQPQSNYPQQESNYAQQQSNYAQQESNYAQQQSNYAQQQSNFAQQQSNYAQQQSNYDQQQSNYPQPQSNYPEPQFNYPQQQNNYPQQQNNYPQQQSNYPQQQSNYPESQYIYPQQQFNYPQMQFQHTQMQPQYPQMQPQHPQMLPQHPQMLPQHPQMQPQHPQQQPQHPQPQPQWTPPAVSVMPAQPFEQTPQVNPLRAPDSPQQFAQRPSNQPTHTPQGTQTGHFNQQIPVGQPSQQSYAEAQGLPPQLAAALEHVHLDMAEESVATASNDFARDLYEEVRRLVPGNLVTSPFSVSAVLALAWLGAVGHTAQQITKVLHLPQDPNQVVDGYKHLFQSLKLLQSGGAVLETGSKVFARRGLGVREDFRVAARHVFGAEAEEVDFSQPDAAAADINRWVLHKTHGKIDRFLEPGSLSAETSLVLANAVYFKGRWQTQFDPELSSVKPFRTGAAGAPLRNATFMYAQGDFPYAQIDDIQAKVLRMPYVGGRLSMVVVLPNTVDGLAATEAALRSPAWPLRRVLDALRTDDVHVWLPRFTASTSVTLNGPLARLGLGEVFGGNANFSGLATGSGHLSHVMQKAFIEVNEEGSEAAAASGGIFLLSAGLYNFFKVDHPFLFYIVDDMTQTILFQGHFVHPEEVILR